MLNIIDNTRTDKNTTHSYLELYEKLFQHKKETAKNVLEVGISVGGSIKLWYDYFVNAQVYGVDIISYESIWEENKNKERITLFPSTDAYDPKFVSEQLMIRGKFDMVLDDGPHTLESMKAFIQLYSQLLADDGILIIEDVQSWDWIDELKNAVPEDLKPFIKIYDLRHIKNRYDDIVFSIDKSVTL
jgi:cephalosporin hydroxylase